MPDLELWHIVVTAFVLLFLGGVIGGWIAIVGSVIKASREASHGISPLLEQAAEQMAQGSPQHWATWGLHLLKALDIRVTGEAFPVALEEIRRGIDLRLDTGQWEEKRADGVDAGSIVDQSIGAQGSTPGGESSEGE